MSNFGDHPAGFFGKREFYNGVATQSVRLAGDSSLTRANADAGTSNKIATISFWFKRTELTVLAYLLHSKNDSGAASFGITLDATDSISVTQYNGTSPFNSGQYDFGVTTGALLLRDISAWYHLVVDIDTTEAAEANRIKIYLNGVRQTVTATNDGSGVQDFADEDQTLAIFQDGDIRWGGTVDNSAYAHIYLAECNGVDGLSLDPSYFGEAKGGVWIPKEPDVSEYGNHGFRLQYLQAGVGSAGTGTIGADTSGKGNHFTSATIAAHDVVMPDSPENNFSTWNVLSKGAATTTAEGNLKAIYSSNNQAGISSTFSVDTGKYYFEVGCQTASVLIGVAPSTYKNPDNINATAGSIHYSSGGNKSLAGTETSYGASYGNGDVIGVALNLDDGEVTFYKNNSSQGALSLTSGLSYGISSASGSSSAAFTVILNSGQDSSFAGTETADTNTDGNGIGNFYYAPPSGFLALCTSNLPEPTIGPNSSTQADDYFNTVLYTGNGANSATGQDISGVGFKPDWLWIKRRNAQASHNLRDSTRGVLKHLQSDINGAEDTESDVGVTAFLNDGFRLLGTNGESGQVNVNNGTFVAWNWLSNGGTTSTNNDGDIASTVQVNTTAGFSIVTFTANGSSTDTVGHGLSKQLSMVLIKSRAAARSWHIGHKNLPFNSASNSHNGYLSLDTTAANAPDNGGRANIPNATTFQGEGTNTHTMVAYCFHEVDGYSKFGKYTGNGNADGVFVYTGFRPAFVMNKAISRSGNWMMTDSARSPTNVNGVGIFANAVAREYSDANTNIDLLSNGFKWRTADDNNNDVSETYLYIAFAESPFKHTNAR